MTCIYFFQPCVTFYHVLLMAHLIFLWHFSIWNLLLSFYSYAFPFPLRNKGCLVNTYEQGKLRDWNEFFFATTKYNPISRSSYNVTILSLTFKLCGKLYVSPSWGEYIIFLLLIKWVVMLKFKTLIKANLF